jgi:hypothetical protein
MYRPVTLICQHNYCYPCIEEYYNNNENDSPLGYFLEYHSQKNDKCPLCNFPYTLPPIENTSMAELMESEYPDKYRERKDYFENQVKLEQEKIKREMEIRKEVWNILSTDFNRTNDYGLLRPITRNRLRPIASETTPRIRVETEKYNYWNLFKRACVQTVPVALTLAGVVSFIKLTK